MRILYGVTGEGLGHTMRARVLVAHLRAQGHTVKIAASGRAAEILARHHDDVVRISGLQLVQERGQLERLRTVAANARAAPRALAANLRVARALASAFPPDVVITDFDSFSYAVGRLAGAPIISIDHQHVLSRFMHPRAVRRQLSYDFALVRGLVRRKLPRCDRYIVTSFFFPAPRLECAATTRLVGPVLRPELLRLSVSDGGWLVLYQTGAGDPRLPAMLERVAPGRVRVWGAGRPFSERGFLEDLAGASALVANGGFTALAEAAHLGKPVVSVPMRHQGEQELNAAWLAHSALGVNVRRPTVTRLRRALDEATARRARRVADGTAEACRALDECLQEVA
jgi:uncharacterized protein (TIGR00661 family)